MLIVCDKYLFTGNTTQGHRQKKFTLDLKSTLATYIFRADSMYVNVFSTVLKARSTCLKKFLRSDDIAVSFVDRMKTINKIKGENLNNE